MYAHGPNANDAEPAYLVHNSAHTTEYDQLNGERLRLQALDYEEIGPEATNLGNTGGVYGGDSSVYAGVAAAPIDASVSYSALEQGSAQYNSLV